MTGSVKRYCACRNPATGRQYGTHCPELKRSDKHGEWNYRTRLTTSNGARELRRRGFRTRKAATEFAADVDKLLDLAKGDPHLLPQLGDLIFDRTRNSGHLPDPADMRRRLGVGAALDRSQTVGDWLAQWLAGKKRLRESTARSYDMHVRHYLTPILGNIPLDRLNAQHIADMFDLISEWNDEVAAAAAEGRRPVLPKDVRQRHKVVGVATQHRIHATLRNALNAAWKARRVEVNEALFVELPPERRAPAQVWGPDEVALFLDYAAEHRLVLLYRLVLLRGLRRGEATGLRWVDLDLSRRELRVTRPLLQLGGRVVESAPKTRAGERLVVLDAESAELLRRHRTGQRRERLLWGEAYADQGLVFAREDGSPYPPDYVSRHFRELAAAAGLPVITLHMGRHTAASLALEAGADIKVVSDQLGHSTTTITQNLYQHVRRAVHDGAAEAVVALLPERHRRASGAG